MERFFAVIFIAGRIWIEFAGIHLFPSRLIVSGAGRFLAGEFGSVVIQAVSSADSPRRRARRSKPFANLFEPVKGYLRYRSELQRQSFLLDARPDRLRRGCVGLSGHCPGA